MGTTGFSNEHSFPLKSSNRRFPKLTKGNACAVKKKKYPLGGGVGGGWWQSHPMVSLEYPLCSGKKTRHWKVKWLARTQTRSV